MGSRYRFLYGFAFCLAALALWCPQGGTAESELPNPPAFKEKELLAYKGKGRGTLSGQVFLGSSSGKAITQAGVPVHLIPVTPFTRYWFDHHVNTSSCTSQGDQAPGNRAEPIRQPVECTQDALAQLLAEKRMLPYIRTSRANPTGHFWFKKIPAGRYYILSFIEGGTASRQDERATGIAWLTVDLDAGEKAANLVVTSCWRSLC
jgi:hypothetical protein